MDFRKDIGAGLYNFITRRVVYHSLFWLFTLLVLTLIEGFEQGFWFTLSNEIIRVFFYCLIVYFNLYYLIPNYLTQNKFLTYGGLLILATVIITPLNVIVFYLKFTGHPEAQQMLVESRNFYFLISFLVAGISTIVKIVSDWSQQLKEKQELETQTMQSELRFLKSQINPHFLFNSLNSISALVGTQPEQARTMIHQLSDFLRGTLGKDDRQLISLAEELKHLELYLAIEQVRFGHRLTSIIEHDEKCLNLKLPALLLQPIVENAIKFGLYDHVGDIIISVKSKVENEKLIIEVRNPFDPLTSQPRKGTGFGLNSIQRRLYLLYAQNDLLTTQTENTVFITLLKIPQ